MNFQTFTNEVKVSLENKLHEDCVSLRDVTKNNGITLTGIVIQESNSNMAPIIYLNDYYNCFMDDQMPIEEITERIYQIHISSKKEIFDLTGFTDWNNIKNNVIFKIINAEKNKILLQDIPHCTFHDLAIVFQVLVSQSESNTSTIQITNEHANIWKVDEKELCRAAFENTPKLKPYSLRTMSEILGELIGIDNDEFINEINCNELQMYVLTNITKNNGAGVILYPDVLKDFATALNSNIIILPSSVHESILLPVTGNENVEELKCIVADINAYSVEDQEVLSDSVYMYDLQKDMILML